MSRKLNLWRELADFSVILMNLSWMASWYHTLTHYTLVLPLYRVFITLGGILLLAYWFGRVTQSLRLKRNLQLILGIILILGCFWFGMILLKVPESLSGISQAINNSPIQGWGDAITVIPMEFWVGLVVMVLWWRAITISRVQTGPFLVLREFRIGIISLLIYGVFYTRLVQEMPMIWFYLFFLFSSLLAMAAGRVAVISVLKGGRRSPFDRRWLGSVMAASLMTLGISIGIATLLTNQINQLASWMYKAIFYIGLVVLSPFILLASLLSRLLGALFLVVSTLPPPAVTPTPMVEPSEAAPGPFMTVIEKGPLDLVPAFEFVLKWGLVVLVVILFLSLLRKSLAIIRERDDETEEDLLSLGGLGDIGNLLREAFMGEARRIGSQVSNRLRRGERLFIEARVRRIYAQLLRVSQELGYFRQPSQTPLEFLPILEHLYPGLGNDLRIITEAYQGCRYGELSDKELDIDQVERAWLRVRASGESSKRALVRNKEALKSGASQ